MAHPFLCNTLETKLRQFSPLEDLRLLPEQGLDLSSRVAALSPSQLDEKEQLMTEVHSQEGFAAWPQALYPVFAGGFRVRHQCFLQNGVSHLRRSHPYSTFARGALTSASQGHRRAARRELAEERRKPSPLEQSRHRTAARAPRHRRALPGARCLSSR